jgi:hypothetical protein
LRRFPRRSALGRRLSLPPVVDANARVMICITVGFWHLHRRRALGAGHHPKKRPLLLEHLLEHCPRRGATGYVERESKRDHHPPTTVGKACFTTMAHVSDHHRGRRPRDKPLSIEYSSTCARRRLLAGDAAAGVYFRVAPRSLNRQAAMLFGLPKAHFRLTSAAPLYACS